VAVERAHIQSFIDRFRYKASKARQAQARIKALERLPQIESVIEDAPTRFNFPEPPRIAPPILALERVDIGYGSTKVLRNVSLSVDMDDRIALLGANGNGKSTLAKLLAERLAPLSGEVRRGPRLKVGYFAQHQTDELVLEPDRPYGARAAQRGADKAAGAVGAVRAGRGSRRDPCRQSVGRGEGAPVAGAGHP
jgi:ATP-binding cassette subfamily F protein 3